ncbi:putative oxidoreductase [Ceratocystis platani]|uniref:Putative oxidoreductase n=1 Tax=Ceratocystis fimbriata f. sp. platani TaxID=88771 RepID=A0A0F8D0F9_CERFI|nr:putative oxidoreductase [Ceratocystis platani]
MSLAAAAKRIVGKTILVTGASSGIGKSTALEFARNAPNNLKLILTARRVENLNELATQIKSEVGDGVKVLAVKLDISNPAEVRQFVPNLPEEFKEIDVLVNNAGLVKGVACAPDIAEEDINIMFQTNVTGLINMTQAILPIFKKRPDGGVGDIVNAVNLTLAGAFTVLQKLLFAVSVTVCEFSVVRFYGDKSKADAVYNGVDPLTPGDIAEVIVFAVSRRQNVVLADALIFPSHQGGAGVIYRKPT